MLLHIAVSWCLAAASLAAPQGYGSGSRNSVVQGSALPRRFSVSKGSQGKGYLPPSAMATARPQYLPGVNKYQSSAAPQYQGSGSQYQSSSGSSYRGSSGPQYQGSSGSQYQSSSGSSNRGSSGPQYQGSSGSQYQGSSGSQYQGSQGSQYQGSSGSQYSAGGQYGSGGNQYNNGGSQYTTEDPYAEPANYDFSYEVSAPEYAVMFGHQESRRDMFARGSYKVLLPDGRTQVVEYEADQQGYRPTITYEEAGYSQNGNGYQASSGGKSSYGQKGYGSQTGGQGYRY